MKILNLKLPTSILKEVGLSNYLKNYYPSKLIIRIFISSFDTDTFCIEILFFK